MCVKVLFYANMLNLTLRLNQLFKTIQLITCSESLKQRYSTKSKMQKFVYVCVSRMIKIPDAC